jgi:hypothetical protein
MPRQPTALELCRELCRLWGCAAVPVDDSLVQTAPQRLALAYVVSWLRVAGSIFVLPPWVRMEHPLVGQLIKRLREVPCTLEGCVYCRKTHNAREQLRTLFGHDDFRRVPASKRHVRPAHEAVDLVLHQGL